MYSSPTTFISNPKTASFVHIHEHNARQIHCTAILFLKFVNKSHLCCEKSFGNLCGDLNKIAQIINMASEGDIDPSTTMQFLVWPAKAKFPLGGREVGSPQELLSLLT